MATKVTVEKIGGSATSSAEQIQQNVRRFAERQGPYTLVVSGPGGTFGRLTDDLIDLTEQNAKGKDITQQLDAIGQRLEKLAQSLGADEVVTTVLESIKRGLAKNHDASWVIRQGDEFSALLYAQLMQTASIDAQYVDINECIWLDEYGNIDRRKSSAQLLKVLDPKKINVVAGHPGLHTSGSMADVKVRRGYTDTTGMMIAAAFDDAGLEATYELSKDDVEGILRAHPSIVDSPTIIPEISVAELETMSIGGAQVVKDEVAGLLDGTDVELKVHKPGSFAAGTKVVNTRNVSKDELAIGIANKEVTEIKLNQRNIDDKPGAIADFASVFKQLGISIREAITTSDTVTFYISANVYKYRRDDFEQAIKLLGHEAAVTYETRELIILVGEALRENSKALKAMQRVLGLSANSDSLNIVSFWNNDEEPSVYLVLPYGQAKSFINKLYKELFG